MTPPRLSAILLVLLAACCFSPIMMVLGDECTFPNNLNVGSSQGTAVSPATAQACFDAIPFSETYRDDTVKVLRDVFSLYSFSDISVDSGSPFFLKVDVFAELDRIEKTTYANDYAMVVDIQKVFKQLYDAHTEYVAPAPYRGWYTSRPFIFSVSAGSNNQMEFKVIGQSVVAGATFSQLHNFAFGTDPSAEVTAAIGKVVTHINGLPILDVLQAYADASGGYKSPGVRLNSVLKGSFALASAATTPFLNVQNDTYTFSDGTSLTVALPAFCIGVSWTDVNSFTALIAPTSNRRDAATARNDWLVNDPDVPYMVEQQRWLETVRIENVEQKEETLEETREEEPELLYPRSSLQVIKTSMEGAVVASSINLEGQDYVVLQITTFDSNGGNDTNGWILSFQDTVKAAVDYGQTNDIKNLIVDVSGNGGGLVCLAANLLRVLFPGYAAKPTVSVASYDVRLAGGKDSKYYKLGQFAPRSASYVKVCGADLSLQNDTDWYFPTTPHTRGGKTSLYTNPAMFSIACYANSDVGGIPFQWSDPTGLNWTPTYFFQRIIAVTDGTCGSACSQFLSRAMSDNTVYTVSYGGRLGETMDTSSFAGGNVENWPSYVEFINSLSAETGITLSNLPTSASTKFNFMEFYASGAKLPREFTSLPANAHLNIWPYSDGDIIDELYGQVVTYFSQASDLPSTIECNKAKPGDSGSSSPASRLSVPFWAFWLW